MGGDRKMDMRKKKCKCGKILCSWKEIADMIYGCHAIEQVLDTYCSGTCKRGTGNGYFNNYINTVYV